MLVLPNVTMEPLNVRKKKTTKCNKSIITNDVGTVQFVDGNIKCEKKIRVQPNVAKVRSNVMLVLPNVTIEPSNIRNN